MLSIIIKTAKHRLRPWVGGEATTLPLPRQRDNAYPHPGSRLETLEKMCIEIFILNYLNSPVE